MCVIAEKKLQLNSASLYVVVIFIIGGILIGGGARAPWAPTGYAYGHDLGHFQQIKKLCCPRAEYSNFRGLAGFEAKDLTFRCPKDFKLCPRRFHLFLAEVELRTQGSRPRPRTQKNLRPRPRTAFPRTDTLEAKDRNALGQGQGPRTQAQVLSKKKGLHKNFSSDLHKKTFSKKFFKRFPKF